VAWAERSETHKVARSYLDAQMRAMTESEDTWPSPEYSPGSPKHLHAVGVIAITFAQLERSIESHYHAEARRQGVPDGLIDLYFYSMNEEKRIEAIRVLFQRYKAHPEVIALIGNLLEYFKWCRNCRNQILHAENYPAGFGEDPEMLYLIKRIGKQSPKSGYMKFTVPTLRSIADKIRAGVVQSATIEIHLRYLGVPITDVREPYLAIVREPLPSKLQVPRYLELSQRP
jgi:hypothetical protein